MVELGPDQFCLPHRKCQRPGTHGPIGWVSSARVLRPLSCSVLSGGLNSNVLGCDGGRKAGLQARPWAHTLSSPSSASSPIKCKHSLSQFTCFYDLSFNKCYVRYGSYTLGPKDVMRGFNNMHFLAGWFPNSTEPFELPLNTLWYYICPYLNSRFETSQQHQSDRRDRKKQS